MGLFDQPDVPKLHGHSVFLEHQRPLRGLAQSPCRPVGNVELLMIIDFYAVEVDRRLGVLCLFAIRIKAGGAEINIEGLPRKRGKTWTNTGSGIFGAVVKASIRRTGCLPVGFVDIQFVAVLEKY